MRVSAVVLVALLGVGCGDSGSPSAPSPTVTTATFPSGNIRLAYRLDVPTTGAGPFPAVVMGHGSGPATRLHMSAEAQRLVGAGFAVLRYDKRGVGDSGGVYEEAGNVANSERVETYDTGPFKRTKATYKFPELKGRRGAWIIEFIGSGRSSRALVRVGQWQTVQTTCPAGDMITVLDEKGEPVLRAEYLFHAGKAYGLRSSPA